MRFNAISEKNCKKLYITEYVTEYLENPDEKVFITIKKMSTSLQYKQALIMSAIDPDVRKELASSDIKNIENKIIGSSQLTDLLEKLHKGNKEIIESCIDKYNHSFVMDDGSNAKLDWNFFESLGNSNLIDFIVGEIKSFSSGICLGERT